MRIIKFYHSSRRSAKRLFQDILKMFLKLSYKLPERARKKIISGRLEKFLFNQIYWSRRTQRLYLKVNLTPIQFFTELNNRQIDYLLLRSWENLPSFPKDEDINLLVNDEHRDLINDLVSAYDVRGVKCDIYTKMGSKGGCRFGVPVFPHNLSKVLFEERINYNGVFVPAPKPYFASVAYHAVLHKGNLSGVPGFVNSHIEPHFPYTETLQKLAQELGLKVEITAKGLFNWLKEEGFSPAEDTLTKLVEQNPELCLFETPIYSDIRGGELLVYIIRERLLKDGYLNLFLEHLKNNYSFEILDVKILNHSQIQNCAHQLRGGKWDKGPYKESGGKPIAVVVAFDYTPEPLSFDEQKKQTRMTNRNNLHAKLAFREKMASLLKKELYNGVHSADNEMDARFYLSQVDEPYNKKISTDIERIRESKTRERNNIRIVKAGSTL